MLSDVTVTYAQGLGKSAARQDGTSALVADAVAIASKLELGTPLLLTSLAEAEGRGITRAYDANNKVMLWHHIADFYAQAPRGTLLYVLPVAKGAQLADTIASTAVLDLIAYAKGAIRLLAFTSVSDEGGTYTAAVDAAQALVEWAQVRNKRMSVILEGRNFPADYATAENLREQAANRVSVVISQNPAVAAEDAAFAKYAEAALFMGTLAAIPVSRDAGRVRSGAVRTSSTGLSSGKSDAQAGYYDTDQLAVIDERGYVFLRSYDGLAGYFWSSDTTAAPRTDDCDTVRMGRTLDKAADLARLKALEYMRDDVEIDTSTGYVDATVLRSIEADVETAVLTQMADDVSGIECSIDPEQSLWDSTTPLRMDLAVVARGVIYRIDITVHYSNTIDDD